MTKDSSPDPSAPVPVPPTPDDDTPTGASYYPTEAGEPQAPPLEIPGGAEGGSTHLLGLLLGLAPFTDLHKYAGNEDQHRFRAAVSFIFDFLLRLVVVILLLGIACGVAWKTLAPFQPFWQ